MKFITLLGVALATFLFSSCHGIKQTILPDSTRTDQTVTVTVRDTVFTTSRDSSSYTAPLVISKDGTISLGNHQSVTGKYLQSPQVGIRDNVLQVDCYAQAQRLFHQWKETQIKETQQTVRTIIEPPKVVEKPFTGWQKFQLWSGRVFLILLVFYGIAFFIYHRLNKTIFNG